MNGTQPKNTAFSGSWKADILEIMWFWLKSSQVWSQSFVFAAATAVIGLPSSWWPAVVQPARLPLNPLHIYNINCLRGPREHTLTLRLEVLSQVTSNLSHSGEVKRSGYLLWRGSLCVFGTYTHTHTQSEIDREIEFVPFHLIYHSTNWTLSPMQCVVSGYKEL